ncbi:MAG: hypothetical protein ACREIU_07085 [Planctomycetota bacterium]
MKVASRRDGPKPRGITRLEIPGLGADLVPVSVYEEEALRGFHPGSAAHPPTTGGAWRVSERPGSQFREPEPGVFRGWEQLEPALLREAVRPAGVTLRSETSTAAEPVPDLIHARSRDERVLNLPPDKRLLFEGIRRLREEIGPIDFNVVDALRELREHG